VGALGAAVSTGGPHVPVGELPHLSRDERQHVKALRNRLEYVERQIEGWDYARGNRGAIDFIRAERAALRWALHVLTEEIAEEEQP
jgi:hypothetical protein